MNNVLSYLENAYTQYPDHIAIEDLNEKVSYKRYRTEAIKIGVYISQLIKEKNEPIFVVVNNGVWCPIVFMGIVYSGNFYVPLDGGLPKERQEAAIDSVKPKLVITYEDYLEITKVGTCDQQLDPPVIEDCLDRPLFGIFTSGSTGQPKLVIKSHLSVIEMTHVFNTVFGFSNKNVFGNQAPFYFDVSAKDIYISISQSGKMVILPKTYFSAPHKLLVYMAEKKINTLIWSTFALRLLAKFKTFDGISLEGIEWIMFSGEAMPKQVINYWMAHVPAKYVNLYGSTETTFNCMYKWIQSPLQNHETISLGMPFENSGIILLDEDGLPSEKGEICVSGPSLAMGYYKDPVKTNEKFILYEGQRFYKTGDLGQYNQKREIVYLSRKDHQIKHMGHRIELDEIEEAINNMEEVSISCCLYHRNKEKIVLFYQSKDPIDSEIFTVLKKQFPKYMLPNKMFFLSTLPLNRNGKVNRSACEEMMHELM